MENKLAVNTQKTYSCRITILSEKKQHSDFQKIIRPYESNTINWGTQIINKFIFSNHSLSPCHFVVKNECMRVYSSWKIISCYDLSIFVPTIYMLKSIPPKKWYWVPIDDNQRRRVPPSQCRYFSYKFVLRGFSAPSTHRHTTERVCLGVTVSLHVILSGLQYVLDFPASGIVPPCQYCL